MIRENISYLFRGGYSFAEGHRPPVGHDVPVDFVGVCVAAAPHPDADAYILQRLADLGSNHVRLDYTYGSDRDHVSRLLERLLANDVQVLLHLVQPREEADRMDEPATRARWQEFVATTLHRWGGDIEAVEIGSTVNRRKWAGYSVAGFQAAWELASREVRGANVPLVGPNVTDFEPFHNVALLAWMRKNRCLPDVHSDNLFVERATEPEAFDHKIAGRRLAPWIGYNLIKKARLLHRIGCEYGVPRMWSTHVAWSQRRIRRFLPNTEEKLADYVARYVTLAAASGALERMYWAVLIGQREGLIDDGTDWYPPEIPHVTLYAEVPGNQDDYRVRSAFHSLRTCARFLQGKRYEGRLCDGEGLEVHAFRGRNEIVHVVWCVNGRAAEWDALYDRSALASVRVCHRDGRVLDSVPDLVSESPVYLCWSECSAISLRSSAACVSNLTVASVDGVGTSKVKRAGWHGFLRARDQQAANAFLALLRPERLHELADASVDHPLQPGAALSVVATSRPRDRWNAACELLRRGLPALAPVLFWEPAEEDSVRGYFVWEDERDCLSLRDVFANGVDMETEYTVALARSLEQFHRRGISGVVFRPENLRVRREQDGAVQLRVIDPTGLRTWSRKVPMFCRLLDCWRVLRLLRWSERSRFVTIYREGMRRTGETK